VALEGWVESGGLMVAMWMNIFLAPGAVRAGGEGSYNGRALGDGFSAPPVIFARSTLLCAIARRAAVRFQVAQVRILRCVLFRVCHVDQQVEATAIRIATDYRLELLFVQQEQFLDSFAKSLQKAATLATKRRAGLGCFRFGSHILGAPHA
jgi:hypothetical protein